MAHCIEIACLRHATPGQVFESLRQGRLFALTGADTVEHDVLSYLLTFAGRGTIQGEFLEVVPDEAVTLSWNVEGFWPTPENTQVGITLLACEDGCQVTLRHSGIPTQASAAAKERNWRDILREFSQSV